MAATISIDPSLNLSEEVATVFLSLMDLNKTIVPVLSPPQILLTSIRSGMSSEILSSSIISRLPDIGIPINALEEGSQNVFVAFVQIFSEEIVSMLQNDMRIDVALNEGILLSATGANSGGILEAVGQTLGIGIGNGVAR